jgi:hypothetical protein
MLRLEPAPTPNGAGAHRTAINQHSSGAYQGRPSGMRVHWAGPLRVDAHGGKDLAVVDPALVVCAWTKNLLKSDYTSWVWAKPIATVVTDLGVSSYRLAKRCREQNIRYGQCHPRARIAG